MDKECIQWLFFDVGSTLVDETKAVEIQFRRTVEDSLISYEEFNLKVEEYSAKGKHGYKEACKFYGLERKVWPSEEEFLYDGVVSVLEKLAKKYQLGIIANQLPRLERRLEILNIRSYFSVIISSSDVQLEKPDIKIFEIALKNARCKPNESVMIGDRIDNDISPAKSVGMNTIWIQQNKEIEDNYKISDIKMNNFIELLEVL